MAYTGEQFRFRILDQLPRYIAELFRHVGSQHFKVNAVTAAESVDMSRVVGLVCETVADHKQTDFFSCAPGGIVDLDGTLS